MLTQEDRDQTVKGQAGRGHGAETLSAMTGFCIENMGLQRLWTQVHAGNAVSSKMLEKCGYAREGLTGQGKTVNSRCDYFVYGILPSNIYQHTDSGLYAKQKTVG